VKVITGPIIPYRNKNITNDGPSMDFDNSVDGRDNINSIDPGSASEFDVI
jgi:hypothetical protein